MLKPILIEVGYRRELILKQKCSVTTLIGCVSDLQQSHSYLHNGMARIPCTGVCMNLMSYLMSYRIATLDHDIITISKCACTSFEPY